MGEGGGPPASHVELSLKESVMGVEALLQWMKTTSLTELQ